jgi:hypothetical protein
MSAFFSAMLLSSRIVATSTKTPSTLMAPNPPASAFA